MFSFGINFSLITLKTKLSKHGAIFALLPTIKAIDLNAEAGMLYVAEIFGKLLSRNCVTIKTFSPQSC